MILIWCILLIIGIYVLGYNAGKEYNKAIPLRELRFIQRINDIMEKLEHQKDKSSMDILIEIQKEIIKELDNL